MSITGLNFERKFGNQAGNVPSGATAQSKPAAQFWLNIGYQTEVVNEDGSKKFVSLPMGIPLDTMEPAKVNSSNKDYAAFMSAKNDLLNAFMAEADKLAPGEEKLVNLQIQLRRVTGPQEAIAPDANPYSLGKALLG